MLMMYEDFVGTTPKLDELLDELRKKLRAEGCTWPLMKWRGFLADDSRIYNICEEENIPYSTQELLSTTVPEAILDDHLHHAQQGKIDTVSTL